jgi:VIT1/CCC1 family predicted Fe2+/Mn2+ transporter
MDTTIEQKTLSTQKEEITAYHIYSKLAAKTKNEHNAGLLKTIADQELEHYELLKSHTNRDIKPSLVKIFIYTFLARLLGLTFSLKLMEKSELDAQDIYENLKKYVPEAEKILRDEETHEKEMLNMIDEEALNYAGSVVLGLNDALVELTGALAGFTFAIQKSRTIALLGLITGVAASLSMAASEFLSQRQEGGGQKAAKSSFYTGVAYIGTVALLILPFLIFPNPFLNLGIMLLIVLTIIFIFNFYIAIAKDLPFTKRFAEMALISIGVALLSFGIGYLVRKYWRLDI